MHAVTKPQWGGVQHLYGQGQEMPTYYVAIVDSPDPEPLDRVLGGPLALGRRLLAASSH